jgi:hypothetical protein
MQLGYDSYHALIVFQDHAEVVFIRKNQGVGHSFLTARQNMGVTVTEYDEQLDIHYNPLIPGLDPVHVVATAPRRDMLPPIETFLVPAKDETLAALAAVRQRVEASDLDTGAKHHLLRLFTETSAVTLSAPFMGVAPDSYGALEEAAETAIYSRRVAPAARAENGPGI